MNRSGSSAQQASNCSLDLKIVHDSDRAFPLPHCSIPLTTPPSTRISRVCSRSPRSRTSDRLCGALVEAVHRSDMTTPKKTDGRRRAWPTD